MDGSFWPAVAKESGIADEPVAAAHGLDVEIETGTRSNDLRQDVQEGVVKDTKTLTAAGEPEKNHIEIQLPTGMTYQTGDYLAVLPINNQAMVKKIMTRFSLPWDAQIMIKSGQNTVLPTGKLVPVFGLLAAYVELNQPATQKNVAVISKTIASEPEKMKLAAIHADEISEKRISVFDLLEMFPNAALPFGDYLAMLPPMRVRQYSISSSPLHDPTSVTLTYGVLDQEAKVGGKRYLGTASNYLSELAIGDKIRVAVRPSHQAFHLPLDVENVPVIMVCAGSGLAPFHGFVQERAKQIEAGRKLAPALLFVGCRAPSKDVLYAEEFKRWESIGAVSMRYAFSKAPEKSEGCKYVQDRVWNDRADARELWQKGARIFVCGNNTVGEEIREVMIKTFLEGTEQMGFKKTRKDAEEWFKGIKNERFASDVFA
jgi:cytochrome P450/NADPH-cytochrome P450 reductase